MVLAGATVPGAVRTLAARPQNLQLEAVAVATTPGLTQQRQDITDQAVRLLSCRGLSSANGLSITPPAFHTVPWDAVWRMNYPPPKFEGLLSLNSVR
jgi:hypothetical protein